MFRKNHSNSGSKGSGSSGKWGQKKGSAQPPRKVSPNYRVNLLHHNTMANGKGPAAPYNPGGQGQSHPARPVGVYQAPKPQPQRLRQIPPQRPPVNSITIKNELFQQFQQKLSHEGKSAYDVVNELVALYVDGKIDLTPPAA